MSFGVMVAIGIGLVALLGWIARTACSSDTCCTRRRQQLAGTSGDGAVPLDNSRERSPDIADAASDSGGDGGGDGGGGD